MARDALDHRVGFAHLCEELREGPLVHFDYRVVGVLDKKPHRAVVGVHDTLDGITDVIEVLIAKLACPR
jgi:hypothetical protein